AGADDSDSLVPEFGQVGSGSGSGVVVIPSARVKCVSLECRNSFDAGKFRLLQVSVGHRDEPRAHRVTVGGRDDPSRKGPIPTDLMDLGLKARVAIQIVVFGDASAVRKDLIALGVLLCWDVTQLLQ